MRSKVLLSLWGIYFLMYYLLPLANAGFFPGESSPFKSFFYKENIYLAVFGITFVSALIVLLSYLAGYKIRPVILINERVSYINEGSFVKLFLVLTAISFGAVIIFSKQYGGIAEVTKIGALIRGQYIDAASFGFVRYIAGLVYILLPLNLIALKELGRKHRHALFVGLLLNLPTFYILIFSSAGRENLLAPIFIYMFFYFSRGEKIKLKYILAGMLFLMFLVVVLLYGKSFFATISSGTDYSAERKTLAEAYFGFFRNFSYPVYSLVAAIENHYEGPAFFEFWYAPIRAIPNVILAVPEIPSVSSYNTFYTLGLFERMVPPGAIGYYFYNAGMLGVFVGLMLTGFIMGSAERLFIELKSNGTSWVISFVHCIFAYQFAKLFVVGDPTVTIMHSLPTIFFIGAIVLFRKYIIKKAV